MTNITISELQHMLQEHSYYYKNILLISLNFETRNATADERYLLYAWSLQNFYTDMQTSRKKKGFSFLSRERKHLFKLETFLPEK